MPLGEGWKSSRISVNVSNLADERKWVNGSFAWGTADDGDYSHSENDTSLVTNPYQNWTFGAADVTASYANAMSGNYFNSTSVAGRDALELLMEGENLGGGTYGYDEGDASWWSTLFQVQRGAVLDAKLKVTAWARHVMNLSLWEFEVLVNGQVVFSTSTAALEAYHTWATFEVPMADWTNATPVFGDAANQGTHNLTCRLRYASATCTFQDFWNRDYQQVLVGGASLNVTAEADPEVLQLEANGVPVRSSGFGAGRVHWSQEATGGALEVEFSTAAGPTGETSGTSLVVDLQVEASKGPVGTYATPSLESPGSAFEVEGGGSVHWTSHFFVSAPSGYEEGSAVVELPGDWVVERVESPREAGNLLSLCHQPRAGLLIVPIADLSTHPDGFWSVTAESPNYGASVAATVGGEASQKWWPGDRVTVVASFAGHNFTGLASTPARLRVEFPNGSSFHEATVPLDGAGVARFSAFEVPTSGSNYVAGNYSIEVDWGAPVEVGWPLQAGVVVSNAVVAHWASLKSAQDEPPRLVEGSNATVLVQCVDEGSGRAVEGGSLSFSTSEGEEGAFSEYEPGYYAAVVSAPTGSSERGTMTVVVTMHHPHYEASSTLTLSLRVSPTPGPGLPAWALGAALAAVALTGGLIATHQLRFKYPAPVRRVMAAKRRVARLRLRPGRFKRGLAGSATVGEVFAKAHAKSFGPSKPKKAGGRAADSARLTTLEVATAPGEPLEAFRPSREQNSPETLKNQLLLVHGYKQVLKQREALEARLAALRRAADSGVTRARVAELEERLTRLRKKARELAAENERLEALAPSARRAALLAREVAELETMVKEGEEVDLHRLQAEVSKVKRELRDREERVAELKQRLASRGA
ncbi:MAG: hypothetical protein Kow0069_29890 [Promethearchaeota archaeon]